MRPPASSEHRPPKPRNVYLSGVSAQVKWFDPDKGFGFVTPEDGPGDAFLHASTVRAAGYETLAQGAVIVCDLAPGQKGPQVAVIHEVRDPAPAQTRGRGRPPQRPARQQAPPRPAAGAAAPAGRLRTVEGTVKFYNVEKGFGFIVPDRGGKDVFIHSSALRRSGLEALQPQVRVRAFARETEKGLEADRVEFL